MDHQIHGTYDSFLVILSYLIAVAASFSALSLAARVSTSKGKHQLLWLIFGATTMGLGIWSMHFVGMLALTLPIKVLYDMEYVILSVILAIFVSSIALFTVTKSNLHARQLGIAGILMAAGISGMHYVGMAAMIIEITYDMWIVILSIIIAATASAAALWLLFYFRRDQSKYAYLYKLGSSLIMGAAIAGMHYTGMVAAHFYVTELPTTEVETQIEPETLAYIIVLATFLLIGITLFGLFINKRLSQKDTVIQENESWYRSLYKNNEYGIISLDTGGCIIKMNPAVTKIGGLREEEFINQHVSKIGLHIVEEKRDITKDSFDQSFQPIRNHFETTILHPNGNRVELSVLNVPVEIEGEVVGNHIIVKDITEENRVKEKIRYLAYHDELTDLPNRRKFNQVLHQSIEKSSEDSSSFAVMVIDIDRFKMINDSLGHSYGDIFLQGVSDRIVKSAEGYQATIARMGGDEFTILCETGADRREAASLADKIIEALKQPFSLKDSEFYISASIGTAIFPDHGTDAVALLKKADTAMYEVKKQGKNGHLFYTPDFDVQLLENIEIERDLRKAIERNELVVYYQPQFHSESNRMIGVEALVRWNHPTKGMLSPGVFIPIAEETGLIYEIGTWVLREACRQMKQWHDKGGPLIPVSVNLSSHQFHQRNLVQYIKNILEETKLAPHFLELEITESMMMDPAVSISILHELNKIGTRISLDDFGTGYSSLSYLKKFPIHKLKIDRSFITDLSRNDNDKAIVATIISMAKHLKLDVIAEGIETKDQLDILTENHCKEIQGYYYSRPLSANEVEQVFFVPTRNHLSQEE
ncbi:bifunctional diguanylate cyclase/phosphodiesterase [Brevibacillus brevis]|uniref:bifunctional diguanylate cyclase/phosphodiesterase n=1 Tax=Brevibacillus brevis TaxID=1393 RepID=UPI000D0ECBB8|nr:bifunctional diguanylate cyclase/phosphodiesterase [Brevibacillus brevis]PSJ70568.1 PAS domain S-box protein [Brevibacillus brevis]RED30905.1 PAS domain S-box-containing protein/diguanylate cyclase (GGDEF)-like protein [Brevibacillus brevis]VEF89881.1 Bacteriophytochrome cph2 [Brevibacillus brevis]